VVRAALSSVLANRALTPGTEIVLEMSGCDFVDGTGYGLLCEAADMVQDRGCVLHLTGMDDQVARVLARLDQVLRGGVQQHVRGASAHVTPTVPTERGSSDLSVVTALRS
jgi:anti-anti-sigma factor